MDWVRVRMDAVCQVGIKPCGSSSCSTCQSRQGLKSGDIHAFESTLSAKGSLVSSTPCTRGTLSLRRHRQPVEGESLGRYLNAVASGCCTSRSGSLPPWRCSLEKELLLRRSPRSSYCFFNAAVAGSRCPRWICGGRSVSERRLPAGHSHTGAWSSRRASVSERRLPAGHSLRAGSVAWRGSVSERRLPAGHSREEPEPRLLLVYLSDGYPQATACRPGRRRAR